MSINFPKKFTAWLTINRECNLRCGWCYGAASGYQSGDNMSLETARSIVGFLSTMPLEYVVIVGGEPTLHPDFFSIIKIIKDAGKKPVVFSNGIAFADDAFLHKAIDNGLYQLAISLKSTNSKQYCGESDGDTLGLVKRAISNMTRSGIKNFVTALACGELVDSIGDVINLLKECRVQNFTLDMERPILSKDNEVAMTSGNSPKQLADICVTLYPALLESGLNFVMIVTIPFCLFPDGFMKRMESEKRLISGCQLCCGNGLVFEQNGNLLPCNQFWGSQIGKIGLDFSTSEEYISFRKRNEVAEFYEMMSNCPDEKCIECEYWKICGAGCRLLWLCNNSSAMIK